MLAAYFFRFYAMDQSIQIGEKGTFSFFRDPYWPRDLEISEIPQYATLVFNNVIDPRIQSIDIECTISKITHPDFGIVKKIEINAGQYRIETEKGEILIDPEEQIGATNRPELKVSGWLFFVQIDIHQTM